jgi:hypothetical protein
VAKFNQQNKSKVPTQETDKGKTSNNNLLRSPFGIERLASMTKNKKRNGGQGMYSDTDFSTHTEPTLKSLEQTELFTSLMQEDKGNMRSESRDQSRSP